VSKLGDILSAILLIVILLVMCIFRTSALGGDA
jgi:hypothetical protein